MSLRALKPDASDEPPPLTFLCRWRYSPGSFCEVHVDKDVRFCPMHEVEDRDRIVKLREEAKANG